MTCSQGAEPKPIFDLSEEKTGISWVVILYHPDTGKHSPDNPCAPLAIYASALHWSLMTVTSIGYGDIVPTRLEEYYVGCICQLVGACAWAYIEVRRPCVRR